MKTVFMQYEGRTVPFIEVTGGAELLIPIAPAAGSIGFGVRALRDLMQNNPLDFSGLRLRGSSSSSKELEDFLRQNKEVFGIERLRGDMLLLNEDEYLMACVLSRTDVGRTSRRNFVRWQKERALRGCVPLAQFMEVVAQLTAVTERVEQLEAARGREDVFSSRASSLAGSVLRHQRIRDLN